MTCITGRPVWYNDPSALFIPIKNIRKSLFNMSISLLSLVRNIGTGEIISEKAFKVIFFIKKIFGVFAVG